ncbi:MAG: YHYH protein, partial [Gammaproteobacteria bacterium]
SRPVSADDPGGSYDGTYRDDYQYVAQSGDLDECNGMMRDGVYGYYVTASYPWVLACFQGTPDASFDKSGAGEGETDGGQMGGGGMMPPPPPPPPPG